MGNLTKMPHSEVTATLERFEQFGVTPDMLKEVRSSDEAAKHVARAFDLGTGLLRRGHKILGDDFISHEEISSKLGIEYDKGGLVQRNISCPSENILKKARDEGFVVVAGPPKPMSISDIFKLMPESFVPNGIRAFLNIEFGYEDKTRQEWLIMGKKPLADSFGKTQEQQFAMLEGYNRAPNAAEAAWVFAVYAKMRDIHLAPDLYTRTSTVSQDNFSIVVGYSYDGRLYVHDYLRDVDTDYIGLFPIKR